MGVARITNMGMGKSNTEGVDIHGFRKNCQRIN